MEARISVKPSQTPTYDDMQDPCPTCGKAVGTAIHRCDPQPPAKPAPPPMDTARVTQVIETTILRRGKGYDEADPMRVVTQYWTLDGRLIAEVDPFRGCNTQKGGPGQASSDANDEVDRLRMGISHALGWLDMEHLQAVYDGKTKLSGDALRDIGYLNSILLSLLEIPGLDLPNPFSTPNPALGWRDLNPGEIIRMGDERWEGPGGWHPVQYGECYDSKAGKGKRYRRRIPHEHL